MFIFIDKYSYGFYPIFKRRSKVVSAAKLSEGDPCRAIVISVAEIGHNFSFCIVAKSIGFSRN
jgi:hypothetical protein